LVVFFSSRLSAQSKLYPQGTAPRYNGLPTEKYFGTQSGQMPWVKRMFKYSRKNPSMGCHSFRLFRIFLQLEQIGSSPDSLVPADLKNSMTRSRRIRASLASRIA
jgi:hypothetical protein